MRESLPALRGGIKMLPLKANLSKLTRFKNSEESRLGYLRLDKNENIVPFPSLVMKKLQKAVTADFVSAYPEVDSLYRKLAQYEKCFVENIYLSSGSDGVIKAVFEVFVEPGDRVLLLSPSYAMFYVYAKMFDAELREIFCNHDLSISVDKIVAKIKAVKPKLVCLANPNSPTGTVLNHKGLEKVIQEAAETNAVILIDEAYYLFYPKSVKPLIRDIPNLVVTRTFSKALGLASARLGYALGHADMIQCLHKVRPMYETNAYALQFAEIVLDHVPLIKKNLKVLQEGKRYLEKQLRAMRLPYFKSYANFVLIDMGSKEKALQITKFLKDKKILVKSGFDFLPLQCCIRVNIGDTQQMEVFLKALKQALGEKIIAAENQLVSV